MLESIKNDIGEPLLHWAAASKKIDILWFLLSSGADVHVANDNGWSPLTCALHSLVSCNSDEYLCAALLKTLQAARILLDHGADPLAYTAEGWTPFHCLSLYLNDRGSNNELALTTEFIARGVLVDAQAIMLARASMTGVANYSACPTGTLARRAPASLSIFNPTTASRPR